MAKKESCLQFFKFVLVGILGTLIHIYALYFFTEFFGFYYILSSLFGYIIAFSFGFFFNKIWTFKESVKENFLKKYIKFSVVAFFSLIVNLSLLYVFTEFFNIYYLISQIFAGFGSLIVNFSGSRIWTFKK